MPPKVGETYLNSRLGNSRSGKLQEVEGSLKSSQRQKVNVDLIKAGLDGNKHYDSIGAALGDITEVLTMHGIEPDGVFSSHRFLAPSGKTTMDLAWSNKDDPFSPKNIPNTMLVVQWHKFQSENYEVIAYLS